MEKQFRRYYEEAARTSRQDRRQPAEILESRLDNVIYRAGLARTRRAARQLVTHGHFEVNGKRWTSRRFRVEQFDIITVGSSRSRRSRSIWPARRSATDRSRPGCRWLPTSLRVLIHQLPARAQIDTPHEQLIVELYSK